MPKHSNSHMSSYSPQMWTPSSSSAAAAAAAKTMEEVWEDIALTADLHHHPPSRGVILQDFFSNDPPPTNLTLSSSTDRFNALLMQPHHRVQPISPGDSYGGVKNRLPGPDRSSGDHRHKRMIKNRESAARSRARKQAYTVELEHAIAQLMEENDKLKKQQEQEQLLRAAAAAEHVMWLKKKKNALQRTLTAPF